MLFASSAFAVTNVTQTIDGVLGGKEKPKFDKKKFKKTSVKVTTTTADADNPSGMPPKAEHGDHHLRQEGREVRLERRPGLRSERDREHDDRGGARGLR